MKVYPGTWHPAKPSASNPTLNPTYLHSSTPSSTVSPVLQTPTTEPFESSYPTGVHPHPSTHSNHLVKHDATKPKPLLLHNPQPNAHLNINHSLTTTTHNPPTQPNHRRPTSQPRCPPPSRFHRPTNLHRPTTLPASAQQTIHPTFRLAHDIHLRPLNRIFRIARATPASRRNPRQRRTTTLVLGRAK